MKNESSSASPVTRTRPGGQTLLVAALLAGLAFAALGAVALVVGL